MNYRIIGADGKTYGPVGIEQIRQWLAEGRAGRCRYEVVDTGHYQAGNVEQRRPFRRQPLDPAIGAEFTHQPLPAHADSDRDFGHLPCPAMRPGMIRYSGYAIEDLIGRTSFAQMIWLMTRGELPSEGQGRLLDAALMSAVTLAYASTFGFEIQPLVPGDGPLKVCPPAKAKNLFPTTGGS